MGTVLEGGQPEPPAIQVRSAVNSDIEREVLAGIEEEGVPCIVVRPRNAASADDLAREAARRSSLDVGVGIDADGRISVAHEMLREPVPGLVSGGAATPSFARRAGHNAARIVVGIPLRL
ncbi:glycerol dehydratase reactivase beta/small subunit family protein [Mycobacterium sp. 236(2023)]|uniref:glycerol dehydratase reactivase beta/small subunit family protein n=1 Tax=Mycobacterium sp. 236(2023) TaxID=3038163 RepID=UPI002414F6B5|nr:glycerol dehydratase reactivase beta/small subunit family protein [Mycobacterium sp. 236(2023)]MDG4664035.1 glycerol dehydratase reactivase beta/small subunit family protein [Mycobacterium sp. 236(2023)]